MKSKRGDCREGGSSQLIQERDKQHDVANGQGALSDALDADDHPADEPGADDDALDDVEGSERREKLELHLLQAREAAAVKGTGKCLLALASPG